MKWGGWLWAGVAWLIGSGVGAADLPQRWALETLWEGSNSLWETPADAFMSANGARGFRWLSTQHDGARAYRQPIQFVGLPADEVTVRFSSGGVTRVEIALFSRGEGDLAWSEFEKLVKGATEALSAWTGTAAKEMPKAPAAAGVKTGGKQWALATHRVRLEWSYSTSSRSGGGRQPEYVRVHVAPLTVGRSGKAGSGIAPGARVRKEANGDVWLEGVPMVDQGARGYCAAAVVTRVLQFYGNTEIDQHQVAQLAQSTSEGGTSPSVMIENLRRMATKLDFVVRPLQTLDIKGFMRLIDDYNRTARRADRQVLDLNEFVNRQNALEVEAVYEAMAPELLRQTRSKDLGGQRRFVADINKALAKGWPVAWGCMIGMFPETPPVGQGVGGHMRLIIGYNAKTSEVLYTDTWGPRHELKRLPLADAWAMTTDTLLLEPRGKR